MADNIHEREVTLSIGRYKVLKRLIKDLHHDVLMYEQVNTFKDIENISKNLDIWLSNTELLI